MLSLQCIFYQMNMWDVQSFFSTKWTCGMCSLFSLPSEHVGCVVFFLYQVNMWDVQCFFCQMNIWDVQSFFYQMNMWDVQSFFYQMNMWDVQSFFYQVNMWDIADPYPGQCGWSGRRRGGQREGFCGRSPVCAGQCHHAPRTGEEHWYLHPCESLFFVSSLFLSIDE